MYTHLHSLRVAGVGGPWVHCGCALALQAYYRPHDNDEQHEAKESVQNDDNDDETFAAVAMGCGSNAPLRAREGPAALLLPPPPDLNIVLDQPGLLPPLPAAMLPLPPPPTTAPRVNTQPGIMRHIHTRYVRAVDEACQGSLDSPRCLFDHEA
jgi:hypothetical protein